ncbi:MAG: cytochrome c oxidase subunit 3 [Steroidobacteraceae bacterium]|nr:cytochrome c oxidase subunit 3 [Steroidobacteraceae bacterium]
MATTHEVDPNRYYVPHSSPWPIFGSVALFVLAAGAALTLEQTTLGPYVLGLGFLLLFVLFFGWFRNVVDENQAGMYNAAVDRSFRMGMMWFIFSEVMFFAAFFGALFYARQFSLPWLSGEGAKAVTNVLLWPGFEAAWPSNGPADLGPRDDGSFETIPAFGLPAFNTLLLLTSGVTITIAHHALRAGKRAQLSLFLAATWILGFIFLGVQIYEYHYAYTDLGLTLGTGIYGSTFFMLTGFHGFHVMVGAIMLLVIWLRVVKGHFSPERHFAFEATAWYWHFVDVVWLILFVFVYWL